VRNCHLEKKKNLTVLSEELIFWLKKRFYKNFLDENLKNYGYEDLIFSKKKK
jgi:hypothetical protein